MQNLDKIMIDKLIETAIEQLKFSYTPYSNFKVGAALLAKNGEIYTGCNIENAAYTPTNCAERTAFFKAVSEGIKEFDAICIVGGKDGVLTEYAAPCGVCRQVMMEFCNPETFKIILAVDKDHYDVYILKELLPQGFGPRFHDDLTSDNIVVSHVLDDHIISDVFYLFSDWYHIASLAETDPVILRKCFYHCGNFFISFSNRLPVDTFQCIIKKMWLDL